MNARDKDAITKIFEETLPSMVRTRDISGYVSLFTEDGIWIPQNALARRGHDEIAEGLTAALAGTDIDPTFTADEVVVIEHFGYILGRSVEKMTPIGGGPTTVAHSRELWLFRKEQGTWKIARLIYNLAPEPSGSAA